MGAFKSIAKRAFTALTNDTLYKDSRNIERWRQRKALEETGEFVEQVMPRVQSFAGRYALMKYCCAKVRPNQQAGMVCEFGVAAGKSINYIAQSLPDARIFGFDSFEGLPEDWRDGAPKGTFRTAQLPKVAANVSLIQGWFNETLPCFLDEHPEPVIFLHVDCDLYSSTRTVFTALEKRLCPGTVILFDEFFNYPGWKDGEIRAFTEFVEHTGLQYEYLGYNRYGTQAAVVVK
ncbi:MAG: class I SAM-dependent methyltransferase [Chloroflexota bacterium]